MEEFNGAESVKLLKRQRIKEEESFEDLNVQSAVGLLQTYGDSSSSEDDQEEEEVTEPQEIDSQNKEVLDIQTVESETSVSYSDLSHIPIPPIPHQGYPATHSGDGLLFDILDLPEIRHLDQNNSLAEKSVEINEAMALETIIVNPTSRKAEETHVRAPPPGILGMAPPPPGILGMPPPPPGIRGMPPPPPGIGASPSLISQQESFDLAKKKKVSTAAVFSAKPEGDLKPVSIQDVSISAAPQLRDLEKERLRFIPTSLRSSKTIKSSSQHPTKAMPKS